eukprot:TRINITY_DN8289_c0_g1_i7.p1 TRINITY_DN8289_c0_g1~~TRINITY_DN8289_c0_g1_i7.p1  ORF type:complete len:514 (-),score=15.04 TRINITY_DN8289_c0_g1_i7:113-1654(-)
MSDLSLRDGLSVVCFTRQGATSPFFAIREFDTKILRLPTGREGGNLRVQGVSEQAIRARITQVMMKLQLVPFKGLKSEVKILKQRGILGKRAPKCSLLKGTDMINLLRAFGKESFANDLDRALQEFKKKPRTLKPRSAFSMLREKQGATPEQNRAAVCRGDTAVKRSLKFAQPPSKRKKVSLPYGTQSTLKQIPTQNDSLLPSSSASSDKKQTEPLEPSFSSAPTSKLPSMSLDGEPPDLSGEAHNFYPDGRGGSEKSLNCDPDPMASQNLLQASVTAATSIPPVSSSPKPKPSLARMKAFENDAPPLLLQQLTRSSRSRSNSNARNRAWKCTTIQSSSWGGSETLASGTTTTRFPPMSIPPTRTVEEQTSSSMSSVYPFKPSFNPRADANTWNEINCPKTSQENSTRESDSTLSRMTVLSPPSTFNFDFSALSKMMFLSTTPSKINFDLSALDSFIESLPDSPGHPSVTISTETLTDYDHNTSHPFSDMSSDSEAYWRTCQGLPSLLPSLLH